MKVLRILAPALLLAGLCACGGGGGGGLFGGGNPIGFGTECNTGTAEELANPQPNTYAPGANQITLVASGNNNNLYSSYQNWYVYVVNTYTGQTIQGNQLTLVSDPNGPHPYQSDFYYGSSLQQSLPGGGSWNVYLAQYSGSCTAIPLQSFTT